MAVPLRLATRASALARWQAGHIASLLDVECELVLVSTEGDRRPDEPLHEMGGRGVFASDVQTAVLRGDADAAVHSAKDLPSLTPAGLTIAAVPERGDPRDGLVGSTLNALPTGGRIGTGSVRRRSQLAALRPDLVYGPLRGNIDTRLAKAGDFDAIVVAVAALERLGYQDRIAESLDLSTFVPQVGQGALAVECRADDAATLDLLASIEDATARRTVDAERAFLARLGGGCDLPCAAHAVLTDRAEIRIDALLASLDGHVVLRTEVSGDDPGSVGERAAVELLEGAGGRSLLEALA